MIDIPAIRARIRQPTPKGPTIPVEPETDEQKHNRDALSDWCREWAEDRRDLHAALDELERHRERHEAHAEAGGHAREVRLMHYRAAALTGLLAAGNALSDGSPLVERIAQLTLAAEGKP